MQKFVFLLFIISNFSFGQNSVGNDSKVSVKISPLSLIQPFVGPCAKLSIEYRVKNNIAFQNEIGIFFHSSSGFETRFEVKRYIEQPDKTIGNYFSMELFYKYQYYTTPYVIDTADPYEQNYLILEPFDVNKHVESLTFKYGQLNVFKYGFIIDAYCGLGIRFQQIKNSLSTDDNASLPPTSDYGPNLILDKARNTIYPNLLLGVKIGFRVK